MTRNKMLLIFQLAISAFRFSEEKTQHESVRKYIREIIATNEQRSLILVYRNVSAFAFSECFYGLELPVYNIFLENLKSFNGKYEQGYDITTTFEENKLYFIFIDKLEDFRLVLPAMRKIYFWRDRDKVVVFINGNYSYSFPEMKATFSSCYKFYIVNIAFAFIGDEIESFSYNPFVQDYSLSLNPRNLFPDKFRNLYGYRLRISMFPSVINTFQNGIYLGSDGFMSRAIAQHLNATYTYIHPRITDAAPVINQYDDVAERVVDVGFNTRYIKFNFKNLIEKTYPHDRDDLTCLIPKIAVEKVTGLYSLLEEPVWFLSLGASLFFLFYVVGGLVVEGKKLDVTNAVMVVLALLVNKPVKEEKRFDFRLALISYMTFCFFLTTLIVGRLTSIFTAPAHFHGIETLKELAETDYEILTIDRFEELLNASLVANLRQKILPRLTLIQEDDYLGEISKCRNVVFICKDHLANYAQIQRENYPNGVQFYRIMRERILPTLSCYIVSYGSPFLERIDNLVRRIVESGIHDYWKMTTWDKLGIHDEFRFNQNSYGKAIAVSVDDVWTGIQVLLYGFGTSFFVFLLELVTAKCKCSRLSCCLKKSLWRI